MRISISVAARIKRSTGLRDHISFQRSGALWPTKICVTFCSRANRMMAAIGSEQSNTWTSASSSYGQRQVRVHGGLVLGAQSRLPDVADQQIAVEPVRVPPPAAQHGARIAARRDTNQNALLRSPAQLHAVRPQVVLQLPVDHIGRQQQREFPQFRKPAAQIHRLQRAGALHHIVDGRIHQHDLVRGTQESLRHGLPRALAGDALHGVLMLFDVLQIDGGDHRDALIQDVVHILPAFRIARARRIIVGQFVHQADARMAAENRRDVQHFVLVSGVCFLEHGDVLEGGHQRFQIGRERKLDGGHHHIFAAFLAPPPFVQHAERLAHARGVTQEHLEPAAPGAALFGLHAAQ
jgi:hypothetical protein